MKISIRQDDEKVHIKIEHSGVASGWSTDFYARCGSKLEAQLLTHAMQSDLAETIKAVREAEYIEGRESAKKKRRAKDFFRGWL